MKVVVWAIKQDRTSQLQQAMEKIGVDFAMKEEETKFTWSNLDSKLKSLVIFFSLLPPHCLYLNVVSDAFYVLLYFENVVFMLWCRK